MRKVTEIAEKADTLASTNQKEIQQLQASVGELREANESLSAGLDDQINRSMRSTLILRELKKIPMRYGNRQRGL